MCVHRRMTVDARIKCASVHVYIYMCIYKRTYFAYAMLPWAVSDYNHVCHCCSLLSLGLSS